MRCPPAGLAPVRARLGDLPLEALEQIDTYFAVRQGRLKLRQTSSPNRVPAAELIAYARPDELGPRWSAYRRVPITATEAPVLRAALAETVGILVIVEKTRLVAVRGRTRVHLDSVQGLGDFVELETVAGGQSELAAVAELNAVVAWLGLDVCEPVAGSYSDLLLAAAPPAEGRREGR